MYACRESPGTLEACRSIDRVTRSVIGADTAAGSRLSAGGLAATAQLGERHVDGPEAPPEAALLEQRRARRGRGPEHLGKRLDVAHAAGDALRAADHAVGERRDAAAGAQRLVRGPAGQA